MKKSIDRKKIINILFILAVVILVINLLVGNYFKDERRGTINELTSAEVDSTFRLALANLGIQDEWIIKQESHENPVHLSVRIPTDLPIVLILQEMNSVFDTNRVKLNSVEKKIGGITTLNIISGDETKLTAEINYSSKLRRKTVRIGFIVKRSDEEKKLDSLLLQYPEKFALLLVPSKFSEEAAKKILMNGKEYIVYLNDTIEDLKFKLSDDYSITRLKNSIREIVGAFPRAVFFLMDDNSSLFNYKVYTLLREELEKRKIKLIDESNFSYLSGSEKNNLAKAFNDSLATLNGGEDKLFILSAEDFQLLNSEIMKHRKIGYKFTNPSDLLF